MGNLLNNKVVLKELTDHIIKREGVVNYFYCDNKGYVTIGIGTLVDASQPLSDFLKVNPNIVFKNKITNKKATTAEIIQDWTRVKKAFNPQKPQNEKFYSSIAQLRIDEASSFYLMMKEVRMSILKMYKSRPFAKNLDDYIQIAIIDVRYNPAGINPIYTGTKATISFWKMLQAGDVENAFKEFHRLWYTRIENNLKMKNRLRYLGRQAIRERWFKKGIARTKAFNWMRGFAQGSIGTFARPVTSAVKNMGSLFFK